MALEFAMLAPLTVFTIALGIAFARLCFIDACMHNALLEAAQYGATGADASDGQRQTNIQTMLNAGSFVTPTLTMTPYANWANLTSSPPVPVASDPLGPPGGQGEVVVYVASYTDPLLNSLTYMIPLLASMGSNGTVGQITVTEQTTVQNEPYFSANE